MSVEITQEVSQLIPHTSSEKKLPLEGLYLNHRLLEIANTLGRAIVIANYVSDKNDVIAVRGHDGPPPSIKNASDWSTFQELTAQADVIITGGEYLNRFAKLGEAAQNILTQFEKGGEFEKLGSWRLGEGYEKRSPDIAIVSRSLDFEIPVVVAQSGRKIFVFTTDSQATSQKAKLLESQGAQVIGAGEEGVSGKVMIDYLGKDAGYKVIKMTTGPAVLDILLKADVLDRLYVTRVQTEIKSEDPSNMQTILRDGKKVDDLKNFLLAYKFLQEKVITNDRKVSFQEFLVYDNINFRTRIR